MLQWAISSYGSALDFALEHAGHILVLAVATIGITGYLYVRVPKGFFPQQDTGRLMGIVMGQQQSRIRLWWKRQRGSSK